MLPFALEAALASILKLLGLQGGAVFLYSPHMHDLALAAEAPRFGLLGRQYQQLSLDHDLTCLPVRAARTRALAQGHVRDTAIELRDLACMAGGRTVLAVEELRIAAGERVLSITLCSAAPNPAGPFSALADEFHGQWGLSPADAQQPGQHGGARRERWRRRPALMPAGRARMPRHRYPPARVACNGSDTGFLPDFHGNIGSKPAPEGHQQLSNQELSGRVPQVAGPRAIRR